MTPSANKRLTIFEGPDGAGKTTLAKWFAQQTGARYVHCGPLKFSTKSLARYYAEAMLPAILGYQDVVMDRCWMSENPYGRAFRGGEDRIGPVNEAMLETLAMRCATLVVRCLPSWDLVKRNFISTRHDQMLPDTGQLRQVYDGYAAMKTRLPCITYDYSCDSTFMFQPKHGGGIYEPPEIDRYRTNAHWNDRATSGMLLPFANVVVTEPPPHKNGEMWYRYPGVSFRPDSAEWWLMDQLIGANLVGNVLWVSSEDESLAYLHYRGQDMNVGDAKDVRKWRFFALGECNQLHRLGIEHKALPSAGWWRDVKMHEPGVSSAHPLIDELLKKDEEP